MRVSISAHPVSGLPREVENLKVVINEGERYVSLPCVVLNLDDEANEIYPRHEVDLKATDAYSVDSEGNVVEEGGVMTEYEYYMHIAENVPAKVNDLRRTAITKADTSKKFDI